MKQTINERALLEDCLEIVGPRAFKYLRRGGVLNRWRRSSPHNWWIETKKGEQLWHSEDRRRPSTHIFKVKHNSKNLIITGCRWLIGADEGAPELTTYVLKNKFRYTENG